MDEVSNAIKRSSYQTYLVTCWNEQDDVPSTATWRFRVETPRTGQYTLFMTLEEVLSIIETELFRESKQYNSIIPLIKGEK